MTVGTEVVRVVPSEQMLELAQDPAASLVLACERAKEWLDYAVHEGLIDEIVEMKAQAEAVRIYTVTKGLGKDAVLTGTEIVRRAERGLGLAIRKGQDEGTIAKRGDSGFYGNQHVGGQGHDVPKTSTRQEFFTGSRDQQETYTEADATDDVFEETIEEAKAEGNLSRANVVRKIKKEPAPTKRPDVLRKTRLIDPNRVVAETVSALEGLALGVGLIEVADVDPTRVDEWAISLSNSLKALTRLNRQLKEMTRD